MNSKIIHALVKNYRENQLNVIKQNMKVDDAHSVWFDLQTLKNFISEIESKSINGDPNMTEQDLGIRFYYAAYPQNQEWIDMKAQHPDFFQNTNITDDYAGKHTLILIPTVKKTDSNGNYLHYDFNPLDVTIFSQNHPTQPSGNVFSVNNSNLETETISLNHGSLIPPATPIVETY